MFVHAAVVPAKSVAKHQWPAVCTAWRTLGLDIRLGMWAGSFKWLLHAQCVTLCMQSVEPCAHAVVMFLGDVLYGAECCSLSGGGLDGVCRLLCCHMVGNADIWGGSLGGFVTGAVQAVCCLYMCCGLPVLA
jgi:hypothetical protein